jgi:bacterioferritin (cytochrome b1)
MDIERPKVVALLNRILEAELAGAVRYTHYSLMIFGYNRIPIVSWLRTQATESMAHAQQAGEMITSLGEHPSLAIGSATSCARRWTTSAPAWPSTASSSAWWKGSRSGWRSTPGR